jgi:hypothetical protein
MAGATTCNRWRAFAAAGTDPRAANCLGAEDHTLPREVSMYSQLKLRPLGGGLFCVAWWSMRDRVARQSGRHPKSRQGLGKDTRIRRCDYPKLTRFVKRIPTCSGHVCCIDSGKRANHTEVLSGVKQQPPKSWGRAAGSGSPHCERTMWQIGHRTLQFGLFAKVRGRGAITILDGMGLRSCSTRKK